MVCGVAVVADFGATERAADAGVDDYESGVGVCGPVWMDHRGADPLGARAGRVCHDVCGDCALAAAAAAAEEGRKLNMGLIPEKVRTEDEAGDCQKL